MFLEKRVYQGSSGAVYPLPFIDRIAEDPVDHAWQVIVLENEYLEVWILPEVGGRIHRVKDKTNEYDTVYFQPVIKPALVGLAGPWMSGGIEFNWPQHHRPSTFLPAHFEVENHASGAVTVWLSEHDPMSRMKGMHGVRLTPGSSVLELHARVYNRTADVQTFLWWANVAVEVHEQYQSFFPPDVTFVADHAKRAMSTFPLCSGHYYGVDYAERGRRGIPAAEQPPSFRPDGTHPVNDLSWYANIPVPTSYMCMGTRGAFFGGYDHRAKAGIVHVANPHISPGKKQWTWGNQEFGYAWDRLLTDPDENGICRPYIELMAGVYTDNQPDFSFLQPGETKTWKQHWYPIREIGPADQANELAAVHLRAGPRGLRIGVHTTRAFPAARVELWCDSRQFRCDTCDLSPAAPFVREIRSRRTWERAMLIVWDSDGREIIRYVHQATPELPTAAELEKLAASEPPPPEEIASADELYFTGLHLEQYRHATRSPMLYWQEALRRDPGDARCNLTVGRWHLRRGEFGAAEAFLRRSIERQTHRNPNPADGEAHYQLGRALRYQARDEESYTTFYKATWNQAWAAAAYLALHEIDGIRDQWDVAWEHLRHSLLLDQDNLRARALRVVAGRKLGRNEDQFLEESLALDPLDAWLRHLAGREWRGDEGIRLDLAFNLALCGLDSEAAELLLAGDKSCPMQLYTLAWIFERSGHRDDAARTRERASRSGHSHCFPSRLEELIVLEYTLALVPEDARAQGAIGNWLYAKRRHAEAIRHWQAAVRLQPDNAVIWRCLGIGLFNISRKPNAARRAFSQARRFAPKNSRVLYEFDQLSKRLGVAPEKRLRLLKSEEELVSVRDDLTIEFCALFIQCGQPQVAAVVLAERRFQPWEGGEGEVLRQYVRAHLLLGQQALAEEEASTALNHFQMALQPPPSLGEARHPLANCADIHFWIGEAQALLGESSSAGESWKRAAEFRGDFQEMSVRSYSELTFDSARALQRLGRKREATSLLRGLLTYAIELDKQPATIDYFATSLPTLLLFDDALQARQTTKARFLQAQAHLGLGDTRAAQRLLNDVIRREPAHASAADLLSGMHRP